MPRPRQSFRSYYRSEGGARVASFRADLRVLRLPETNDACVGSNVVSDYLLLGHFFRGGRVREFRGRRRAMLTVACFFTVLIDQAMHHHFGSHYWEFERLARYPKLATTVDNIHPLHILEAMKDCDSLIWEVMAEAAPVMKTEFLEFAKSQLKGFDGPNAWEIIAGYLPNRADLWASQNGNPRANED